MGSGDSRRRTQKQRRRDFAAKVLVATATAEEIVDEVTDMESSEEVAQVADVAEAATEESPSPPSKEEDKLDEE